MKKALTIMLVCLVMLFIVVPVGNADSTVDDAAFYSRIIALQKVFKHGEYWNGYNASDYSHTGSVPCKCSGYCRGDCSCSCGQFYYNGKWYGGQCHGYALRLGYEIFGNNPASWGTHSNANNIRAGDIVRARFTSAGLHTIFVYKVEGDTVYYTECNFDGPCLVTWGKSCTKSYIGSKSNLTIYHAPNSSCTTGENLTPLDLGDDLYAFIIGLNWKHLENGGGNVQLAKGGNDSGDPRQIWHFIRTATGAYQIVSEYDGLCLDAANFGTSNGTNVGVCADNGGTAQRWNIYLSGSGYAVAPAYCGLRMDAAGGSSAPGTNIQLWEANGSAAQVFEIYPLQRDAVDYAAMKPSAPAKPTLALSVDGGTAAVSWTESKVVNQFDSRSYRIDIFSGNDTTGSPVFSSTGLTDRSCAAKLEPGSYTVRLRSINTKYSSLYSDVTRFFTMPVLPQRVVLSEDALTLEAGASAELTATVLPSDADDQTVTWLSSDESVATVSKTGVVYAAGPGKATITAKAGEIGAACSVTVTRRTLKLNGGLLYTGSDGERELRWETDNRLGRSVLCRFLIGFYDGKGQMTACRSLDTVLAEGSQAHVLPLDGDDDAATFKVFCLNAVTPLAEPLSVRRKVLLSDWTPEADVPSGAEIAEEKWTYDRVEDTTASTEDKLEGWEQTGSLWTQTDTGTYAYAAFPEGFGTDHPLYDKYGKSPLSAFKTDSSRRTVSTGVFLTYIYWHWTFNQSALSGGNYNVLIEDAHKVVNGRDYYNFRTFASETDYGQTDPNGKGPYEGIYCAWFNEPMDGSWWWYRFPVYSQSFIEYEKTYTYEKLTRGLESAVEIAGSDTVRNVQRWVRYVLN